MLHLIQMSHRQLLFWGVIFAVLLISGCQTDLPQPTGIPTERVTETLTPSASPSPTITASVPSTELAPPPVLPIQLATSAATPSPLPEAALPTATPAPFCIVAGAGDTLYGLIARGGYAGTEITPDLVAVTRALNGLSSNDIQAGQQYCIPQRTPTPTPQGYDVTQTAVARELPDLPMSVAIVATYVVKEGENITTVQLNSGATLREICALNPPDKINCAGCDVTKPIGLQGCRPIVVVGRSLNVPGPTLTPTISPTPSGLETATPTPGYVMPNIASPANGASVRGPVQLVWLPVTVLQPDEFYLVVWSDMTRQITHQYVTRASTFRISRRWQPPTGASHAVNWQVGVAKRAPDGGSYILVSPLSLIHTFNWVGE